jgi:hypothetical protein
MPVMPARHLVKSMLSLVTLAALPIGASAQDLVAKPYADERGWKIEAYQIGGRHMRCGAIAPTGGKTIFEKSREGWTVVVPTQAKGDTLQGVVGIDGRTFRGPFHRMDDDRVGFFLRPAQLTRIRAGKTMHVRIEAEQTTVPIEGTASVFRKLSECNEKGGG